MYIKTVKLKDLRSVTVLLCVLLAAAAILITVIGAVRGRTRTYELSTEKQRQEFLSGMGWEVPGKYENCRSVTIPEKFSDVYKNYNKLQKQQGFDLTKFKGRKVKIYTYPVKNYKGYEKKDCVKVNLIVCDGKLIGGDVCSVELDGFMQGLKKR